MKFPSLFRTPRHQKFQIQPRYYDPVKEEIEERTSRIKNELKNQENGVDDDNPYASRISGAFQHKRSRSKSINMMQGVILLLLISMVVGYWFFGNTALYIILLLSSILLYLKVKRIL